MRTFLEWVIIFLIGLLVGMLIISVHYSKRPDQIGQASWYDRQSQFKEMGHYLMANGKEIDDGKYYAASWDYPLGTKLKITNFETRRSTIAEVTDRGPALYLYQHGRIIDLGRKAFDAIADPERGTCPVEVRVIQ